MTRRRDPLEADPRRTGMIWLLRTAGVSIAAIADAFELSETRVGQLVKRAEIEHDIAARREALRPTMTATQRLAAAGALPDPRRWGV